MEDFLQSKLEDIKFSYFNIYHRNIINNMKFIDDNNTVIVKNEDDFNNQIKILCKNFYKNNNILDINHEENKRFEAFKRGYLSGYLKNKFSIK